MRRPAGNDSAKACGLSPAGAEPAHVSSPPYTDETNPDFYTRLLSNSERFPMEKLRQAVEEMCEQLKPVLDVSLAQRLKNLTDTSGQARGNNSA